MTARGKFWPMKHKQELFALPGIPKGTIEFSQVSWTMRTGDALTIGELQRA